MLDAIHGGLVGSAAQIGLPAPVATVAAYALELSALAFAARWALRVGVVEGLGNIPVVGIPIAVAADTAISGWDWLRSLVPTGE